MGRIPRAKRRTRRGWRWRRGDTGRWVWKLLVSWRLVGAAELILRSPSYAFGRGKLVLPPPVAYQIRSVGTTSQANKAGAIFRNGCTYPGWVATNGDVGISKYVHSTGVSTSFTLAASFEADIHDNAALMFTPDGHILAAWSAHNAIGILYYRVSTNVEDISAWGTTQSISVQSANAYQQWDYLSTPGRYYMRYRAGDYSQKVRSTTDLSTWDTERTWVSNGIQRPYTMSMSNGTNRIDFVFTSGHPDETVSSMYHAYMLVDAAGVETWFKSDGTSITGPATPANATLIYDGTTNEAWVTAVTYGADGFLRVLFTKYIVTGSDHRHCFTRWTGSAWTTAVEITPTGGQLYSAQPWSDPQCTFDAQHPDAVYLGKLVSSNIELQEWATTDSGATWSKVRDITTASGTTGGHLIHSFTPMSPAGHDGRAAVTWCRGWVDNYVADYATEIMAIGR